MDFNAKYSLKTTDLSYHYLMLTLSKLNTRIPIYENKIRQTLANNMRSLFLLLIFEE